MELEKLIVPITADINGLLKGLDDAKSQAGSLVEGISAIGGGVVAGAVGLASAGIAGLTGLLVTSTKAASEAEGIQADLAATLQSTGGVAGMTVDSVNNLATSLSEVTKFEDDTIVSGENMLLTFTNIGKDVFPMATESMLNMSQKMGTDLQSSAIQLGKALNNPTQGITALTRVGVTFSDEQKKVIESLQKSGDMAGAQKVILAELEKEFGGVAKAAGNTTAGKLEIFKNKLGNIQEAIGAKVLPVLANLATMASEMLSKPEVQNGINAFIDGIGNIANSVIANIPNVITNIQNLVSWFQNNQPIIVGILSALAVAAVTWGITTAGAFITAMTPMLPVIGVLAAIGLAAGLLYAAWQSNFGGIRDTLTQVWTNMQPTFSMIQTWLQTNIPVAIQTLKDFWTNTLLPALITGYDWFQTNLLPVLTSLGNLLGSVIVLDITVLQAAWVTILKPALSDLWTFIQNNLIPIFQKVGEWLNSKLPGFFNGLKGVIDGVTSRVNWLIDALKTLIDLRGKVTTTGSTSTTTTKGRATGGNTSGLTWVGERGPELINFPSGTRVYSNYQSQKITGGDNGETAALLRQLISLQQSNDAYTLAIAIRDAIAQTGG